MTGAPHPRMHGITHVPGGPDPIPGLVFASIGSYSDQVLANTALWVYWPLQDASGDATDLGPLNADLDPVGTPAYHEVGPNTDDLPFSIRFDGSSPAATVTGDSFYDTPGAAGAYATFTVLAWVKPDSAATRPALPIVGNHDLFRTGWSLYLGMSEDGFTDGTLIYFSGNGTTTDTLIGPVIPMDAWSLVGVVNASDGVRIYVDGAEAASDSSVFPLSNTGRKIRVGAMDNDSTDPSAHMFLGEIAGVALFNADLGGATIADIWDAANAAGGATAGSLLWEDV